MYAIIINHPDLTEECIGSIEFIPMSDIRSRTFQLGYWIGREYWGKGLMTEIVSEFVSWIWENFERIARIEAEVHGFNVGSTKVLGKVGFEREGTLRCAVWKDGKLAGLEIWGLLKAEREAATGNT